MNGTNKPWDKMKWQKANAELANKPFANLFEEPTMSRNKGPEPMKTTKHTEQCPRCRWWFTKAGIKRHKPFADLFESQIVASADDGDDGDEDVNPYLLHGEELARAVARRKAGVNW